ncbi:ASCH domain-containing protein [Virgibacillus sp. W0181]|uniref:ASCH domain-containing protein n=1 Tax=Virgibacillus sp. W0181 TaxID=3391581 RepID=UPI003F447523
MSYENKFDWPEKYDINKLVTIERDIKKILKGKKTSVRRNDRYADPGDKFELNGHTIIVEHVYPQKLRDVTEEHAKQEGYQNLEDYKQALTNIHHGAVWDPDMEVWAHELKSV